MRPFVHPNGSDVRQLANQYIPSITAMIDDLIVGFEDAVGEPVVPHELPDIWKRQLNSPSS
ncbi:hypothetical protein JAO82_13240 [Pontibaca sp. S1109L]|uniref:Uncharacterized protein n=1 Tax=Pontibaca salina TaxID=2795731 RepID=A0A934HMJ8_9RHOB|nr:hypothetical protein [Pontibaca salina]